MRIHDRLLNALADRWPNITPDWPGQTFEAWLGRRMDYYNEFGYPKPLAENAVWFESFPDSLWDLVEEIPPTDPDGYLQAKAEELRAVGGTFVQRVEDLRPLARVALAMGV